MAYYIESELFDKLSSVIVKKHNLKYPKAAAVAKDILNNMYHDIADPNKKTLNFAGTSYAYECFSEEELDAVAAEIKKEFELVLGVNATVQFEYTGSHEQEPDIIPPLYWGGTEMVYHYSLSIEFEVK